MGTLIKYLVIVVVILFFGLIAYSYLADLSPHQKKNELPVILNAT